LNNPRPGMRATVRFESDGKASKGIGRARRPARACFTVVFEEGGSEGFRE